METVGGLGLPTVLTLADKLPPPGPLAAKVLESIVSYAVQAFYNKETCIALSQRAQVLLKVLCENWAVISRSSSCQEMLVRFMDTLTKVQVPRYQGQEHVLQHAIQEQGGWSKVVQDLEPALIAELRDAVNTLQTMRKGIEREAQDQAQRFDRSMQHMERQHAKLTRLFGAVEQRISTLERQSANAEQDSTEYRVHDDGAKRISV
ncbi:hypothetical protein WJX72_011207 [[Myrmecia] bisecta]|uniref:Uncharacterized protein n=1 Tax=[Myrmecia] bisecta TaxID=41462 RepID=A0AAW1QGL5_9CHLO